MIEYSALPRVVVLVVAIDLATGIPLWSAAAITASTSSGTRRKLTSRRPASAAMMAYSLHGGVRPASTERPILARVEQRGPPHSAQQLLVRVSSGQDCRVRVAEQVGQFRFRRGRPQCIAITPGRPVEAQHRLTVAEGELHGRLEGPHEGQIVRAELCKAPGVNGQPAPGGLVVANIGYEVVQGTRHRRCP
jgi:hypothetical protein